MSPRVAKQLAAKYAPERVREKLAFLEFLRDKGAVSHPAGWLRTAIIEDYARPDGYLTAAERTARAHTEQEEQSSLFAYQRETQAAVEDEQRARRDARTRRLEQLAAAHHVRPEDVHFAAEVKEHLHNSAAKGSLLHALLPELAFLKLDGHHALFAVDTATALKQLQHPGTQTAIRRVLRFLLRAGEPQLKQEEITLEFCLLEGEPDPLASPAAEASAGQLTAQEGDKPPAPRKTRRKPVRN